MLGSPIVRTDLIRDLPEITEALVIGDLHGCLDELLLLLKQEGRDDLLGEQLPLPATASGPPLIFVGDLVDRGPRSIDTLLFVRRLCRAGLAHAVLGNHDEKFGRWLSGSKVEVRHGLAETIADLEGRSAIEREQIADDALAFIRSLPLAIRFDQGRAVAVHAAWRPIMKQEPDERKIRYFAIYGPTTGKKRSDGYPDRIDWSATYRGPEFALFGHQVYEEPYLNEYAAGIDTGCVFGGRLSAMRWPAREMVSVGCSAGGSTNRITG